MSDYIDLLLHMGLVSLILFASAVLFLLLVGGICSRFVLVGWGAAPPICQPQSIRPVETESPKRRKHDRANR